MAPHFNKVQTQLSLQAVKAPMQIPNVQLFPPDACRHFIHKVTDKLMNMETLTDISLPPPPPERPSLPYRS